MKRLILLLAFILPVHGNDTAINAGGFGPAPLGEFEGDESVIRMVSETIDVHFAKKESQVHCRFTFRSGKKSGDAKQVVGFPDLLHTDSDTGEISKLETFIDGEKVEAKKERGWFVTADYATPRSGLGDPPKEYPADQIQRADFFVVEVNFPPDKDVIVERKYTCASGGDVMGTATFYYTTHTGAVWKGNIGQADFHITLDGFTVDDLAFEDGRQKIPSRSQTTWCMPNRAEWTVVSPTELKMTWKDFEPAVHSTRRGIRLATWSKPPAGK
ncbi:MAG: hypothetical protein JWO82_2821 [Akkermansiaceae bacterium]|nr:hypothetical protein [Akkermansiaceae bacterium]